MATADDKGQKESSRRSRSAKPESRSENPTLQRLAGTPFKTATELNDAEAKIFKETWEELTKAKSYGVLTDKEQFAFFKKIFERGMRCKYGTEADDIVRISLKNDEVLLEINEEMKSKEQGERLISSLAEALSDSFFTNYLKAMRILPPDETPHVSGKRPTKRD